MFVSPSKIKRNKILKGRTISFETPSKLKGNMVIIPTLDKEAMVSTIKSKLFRPMQLLAFYTPRKVKPAGRQATIINQKDYYADIRLKTDGRIRKGKTIIAAYNGQNIVYDIYNEYNINRDVLSVKFKKMMLQDRMYKFFEDTIGTISDDPDYTDAFLVFPLVKPYEGPQRIFISGTDYETTDPLALFVQAIIKNKIDMSKYAKIKLVIFYVPDEDIILTVDLHDPDFEKIWPSVAQKLKRLNAHLMGEDDLLDEIESDTSEDISGEDAKENRKEEIKQVVLSKVAKTIHANNLTDFEEASRDERDLMVSIDKKIDDYLDKKENLNKTLNDMVDDLEKDNDIKSKAVRYVETKKSAAIRSNAMAKGLEKETEIVGSLQDLDDDSEENTADEFKVNVPYIDKRITKSRLSSLDEEYNRKQAMTDLTNVVSSFSNTDYSPMTVDSINIEDSDTDVDDKRTMHVRYKTDDGKTVSYQIDIPKIVDKRFLYLGGNKKVIKKQLVRLPIVKTKSDRVEITTNYQKMTIERVNGKLSRKNAYILKKLKEIKNNPAFTIEYGDNSVSNGKLGYDNDFEYEELAASINKIITGQYILIFNRDSMEEEISLLDVPEDFIKKGMTPLGFEKIGNNDPKGIIYIENQEIYNYDIESKVATVVSQNLFDFITNIVLKLDMSKLPTIGKSFVYTRVKFLQTTYPMFPVVGSQKGITNILQRYKVDYHINKHQEPKNVNYVEVKFKDCYLYYKDDIRVNLLLNSLYLMNPEQYNYSDFDAELPYTQYFMHLLGDSIGIHTRNTLRISLGVMIDPITRDILRDLRQPTDIIDVMLYANTLLVGNQYAPLNDMTNYRIRSNEIVAARLYGILAESYRRYAQHKINGNPINMMVPKGALISELLQEPNINDKSTLNPVIEVEQIAQASAKGYRGVNINSAFTLEMRAYDDTMNGIVSGNSTPYSGQAGITRALTYDPEISSVRGYIPRTDQNKLNAANMLSPTELLSPFTAAGADPPRQAINLCCLL